MMMSADAANAVWGATNLAQDEPTIKASALSVRQRKLLALLNTPMSVDALSNMSGLPHAEVEMNLARFAKLGLASVARDAPASPAELRASSFATVSAPAAPNRMPLIIGGIALTAVAAAIWWFTRTQAPGPAPTVAAASAPAKANQPAPLVAPSDVATTNVFVSGAPATSALPAAPTPAEAAKLAAAAKARETAARDAAANTKQPPASAAAPTTAAPPATTTTALPAASPAASPSASPSVAAATPAAPPPAAAPVAAAPAPAAAPTTQVAAAPSPAPSAAAAPAPRPAAAREGALLARVEPSFPRGTDVDRGTVRARLTVNAAGAVTGVDIVESNPPRIFDRNVRTALQQWRYEGTGETQTKLVEVQFNR